MLNRRDLLKYFAAGTVIAPLEKGMPAIDKAALLVEPPKIEVARQIPKMDLHSFVNRTFKMVVEFHDPVVGGHWRIAGDTMVISVQTGEPIDVTTHDQLTYRRFIPAEQGLRWKMEGLMLATSPIEHSFKTYTGE